MVNPYQPGYPAPPPPGWGAPPNYPAVQGFSRPKPPGAGRAPLDVVAGVALVVAALVVTLQSFWTPLFGEDGYSYWVYGGGVQMIPFWVCALVAVVGGILLAAMGARGGRIRTVASLGAGAMFLTTFRDVMAISFDSYYRFSAGGNWLVVPAALAILVAAGTLIAGRSGSPATPGSPTVPGYRAGVPYPGATAYPGAVPGYSGGAAAYPPGAVPGQPGGAPAPHPAGGVPGHPIGGGAGPAVGAPGQPGGAAAPHPVGGVLGHPGAQGFPGGAPAAQPYAAAPQPGYAAGAQVGQPSPSSPDPGAAPAVADALTAWPTGAPAPERDQSGHADPQAATPTVFAGPSGAPPSQPNLPQQ